MSSASVQIRAADPADVDVIFSLIVELAGYERAAERVNGTPRLLAQSLFGDGGDADAAQGGPAPAAEALIAELDGDRVGFALFHVSFSSWECRPGIWLEDLYVQPQHRRGGIGQALLAAVASIAVGRGCARLEWAVLDWNAPGLDFYEKLGSTRLDEWVVHRLTGDALERVAGERRSGRE